jgi:ABC-type sugar transport system substrate-binding protein
MPAALEPSNAVAVAMAAGAAQAADIVGLITKTNTNPFFVKMREGAEARAKELGMEFRSFAGKYDGDTEAQIEAIESLVAAGAKGILITPSDPAALADTVRRAREAGVLVIALYLSTSVVGSLFFGAVASPGTANPLSYSFDNIWDPTDAGQIAQTHAGQLGGTVGRTSLRLRMWRRIMSMRMTTAPPRSWRPPPSTTTT